MFVSLSVRKVASHGFACVLWSYDHVLSCGLAERLLDIFRAALHAIQVYGCHNFTASSLHCVKPFFEALSLFDCLFVASIHTF